MKASYKIILMTLISMSFHAVAQQIDKERLLDFYQNQQFGAAADYLIQIYPANTTDVKALTQIAYCNMMAGKLVDAEKNYQRINELSPNQLPVLFNLSNINAKRGNVRNATLYLTQIVTIDPNNFTALKQLANYTDSLNLKLQYLKKANLLNRIEPDVAYDLAITYSKMNSNQQAFQTLKIAIEADTSNFILKQALMPIANQLEKYSDVISIGESLLKNAWDAKVAKELGKAYFFTKNYQQAIKHYKSLERVDMQNESTLYYTSLCYNALKKYDMAANYTLKTIKEGISPNIAAYYNLLASVHEAEDRFSSAVLAYQKGLTFSIGKNTYYRLGLLYDLKLKQTGKALTYYRLYLKSKDLVKEDQPQIDYVKSKLLGTKK